MSAEVHAGDTAWVLVSAALVLLMTPGLALFYGGMVRAKSVLNMLMMNFATIAVVSIIWVAYGFSLALASDAGGGLIGGLEAVGLRGLLGPDALIGDIPATVYVAFQMMFAIITPALISGAIAERARFNAWVVFVALWTTIVYLPVAHWVFFADGGAGGWIVDRLGAIDFAGGTAVHINAGAAALALALVLGRRTGWRKVPMRPHNLPLVLLGAALLWFGWFGFNAGSALAADGTAGVTFVNTQVATAAAIIGWLVVERIRDGRPTTLGLASGAVAGLVAVTPSCSSVTPIGAMAIGIAAGVLCALAVGLKTRFGYDDSLDVVGVHLVGGIVSSVLIGLFASAVAPAGVDGLLYGGGLAQLGKQLLAVVAVGGYSFVLSWILGTVVDKAMVFRIDPEHETVGIDLIEHAESAYDLASARDGARGHGRRQQVAIMRQSGGDDHRDVARSGERSSGS